MAGPCRAAGAANWRSRQLTAEADVVLYVSGHGFGHAVRCAELCDAAEGGQVFLSLATASLLEDENLGELVIRDVGEPVMRRTRGAVRAYELVLPSTGETTA